MNKFWMVFLSAFLIISSALLQPLSMFSMSEGTAFAESTYTLDDYDYEAALKKRDGNKLVDVPASSPTEPINAKSSADFVLQYKVNIESGPKPKSGETLAFNFNDEVEGIDFPNTTINLPMTDGKTGGVLVIKSDGSATITFTDEIEKYSNIRLNVEVGIAIFSSETPEGTKKTVTVSKTPYYFNREATGAYGHLFGKIGNPVTRDLIRWQAVGNYIDAPAGVTHLQNLVIEDTLEGELRLIPIPEDQNVSNHHVLIPNYVTVTCDNLCPTELLDIEYELKYDSAGKLEGYRITFNKPIETGANYRFWLNYYTRALDNGDKNGYDNHLYVTNVENLGYDKSITSASFLGGITGEVAAVKIYKFDETNKPQDGAQFTLQKQDNTSKEWVNVEDPKTIEYGQAYFTGLLVGKYRIIETGFAENYGPGYYVVDDERIDGTTYEFEIKVSDLSQDKVKVFEFNAYNFPLKGGISITKKDAESEALLPGATFVLKDQSGAEKYRLTTNANGTASLSDIVPGTYTLEEITAPVGYKISYVSETITIENDATTAKIITNAPKKFTFELTKLDEDTDLPLKDASFTLKQLVNDEWTTVAGFENVKTDENGKISFSNLRAGTYKAFELQSPVGYTNDLVESSEVVFSPTDEESAIHRENVTNKQKLFTIQVLKVDAVSNSPLKDVPFTLYQYVNEEWVEIESYVDVLTNEAGLVEFSGLPIGTYKAVETATPEGYLNVLAETENIELSPEADEEEPIRVTVENDPFVNIVVKKIDTLSSSPLAGAVFELYKLNESDEYVKFSNTPFTTDTKGEVLIPELSVGKYQLIETKAPDRYLKLTTPILFEITAAQLSKPGDTITLDPVKNSLDPNDPRNGTKDDDDHNLDDPDDPTNPGNPDDPSDPTSPPKTGTVPDDLNTKTPSVLGNNSSNVPPLNTLPQTDGRLENYTALGLAIVLGSLFLLYVRNRRRKLQ